MRFNVISYLLKEGIRNVFKNKKSTISCLMIMCATMLIFGLFLVIGENINAFVKSVADAQGIMVYLKSGATDEEIESYGNVLSKELKKLIDKHVQKQDEILVVGLGNIYVTPDALGPKVINEIDVTRHLIKYLPQYVEEGTRPVSAIAPGVLGTTGIETVEILKGIVENIKPKLLIVIDALASRSIDRISSTIQISDTGIVPGAGVGNTRQEISEKTLGIPIISIGIPTVVDIFSCNAKI